MLSKKSAAIHSSPVRELLKFSKEPGFISLAGGIPATDMIDVEGIDSVLQQLLAEDHRDVFQYSVTEGEWPLRQSIANWTQNVGLPLDPQQILITNGSQQGIDLLNRVFLEKDDVVLVERPTYLAALQLLDYTEAVIEELAYQGDQIDLGALETRLAAGGVKMLYLIPTFANPTGRIIENEQRIEIVKLAHRYQVVIVEDDPYGHLAFTEQCRETFFSLAQQLYGVDHNVCYMSSFSKIFSPGLRLGWLALPEKFLMAVTVAKQALDLHTSTLNQHIAARYIASGRIDQRIALLKETYRQRRDGLIESLQRHLGDAITFNRPEGGMFLWCHLKEGMDASRLLKACIEEKVVFVPGDVFFAENPEKNALRLSYSMLTQQTADEAAVRIARALQTLSS
ncbi:DNA-binding transcriptional regulator, MocR family, contains an aminotransferase domain [Rosenbergiella nectarea]|uniref:DNA-binding transcriptional regulator, MocR family, contains an aminotransferase domain n=1 Tax=Rosenbergiella nectarea TaxID=988801 RepID=A0A1H9KF79_9GAMM|nr:PLP-dependent aminotransferase family protein [Rosenbergiella nectarea]SEQ97605.1 DNA-binding transcriptional regulator, MocR family, contains an aminotransferase domain [Rosenbergiella nectarea]